MIVSVGASPQNFIQPSVEGYRPEESFPCRTEEDAVSVETEIGVNLQILFSPLTGQALKAGSRKPY